MRLLTLILILLTAATLTTWAIGTWTGDARWGWTGVILLIAAIIVGVTAAAKAGAVK